jgi:hypothetical protein
MSAFSPIPIGTSGPLTRAGRPAVAFTPLAVGLVVTCLVTLFRASGTVDSDVAWQLWIAGRIHAGANLYTDIIETNPPLWFWMAVPVERAAAIFHLRIETALVLAIGVAVALSLAATDRLTSYIEPRRRTFLLAYAALMLAAMPWLHVGQREQIVLIATIPYAALLAARRQGSAVSFALAAAVGVGAALGFALKHYFLAVPLALELWLLFGLQRGWRPIRPETITIAVVGMAYAAAIWVIEPDFISRIVPLLHLAYGMFRPTSGEVLFNLHALAGVILLAIVATQLRILMSDRAPFAAALAIAATASAAVYVVQFKGWPYHTLPLIGCSALALTTLVAETKPTALLRIIGPAALVLPIAVAAQETRQIPEWQPDLKQAVAGLRRGDAVGFITGETAVPWSVTLQGGYRYPSRYNGFWQMQAIAADEQLARPDPRLIALGQQIVAETVADFLCMPPQRIIVMRPRAGEAEFDILPFFLRNPQFADLLSNYRVRSRASLETYERASPLPLPAAPCGAGLKHG